MWSKHLDMWVWFENGATCFEIHISELPEYSYTQGDGLDLSLLRDSEQNSEPKTEHWEIVGEIEEGKQSKKAEKK